MNSMTGYGRGSAENGRGIVTAELKSVNSRFLEINMISPLSWKTGHPGKSKKPCIVVK
mgnify:CR=1 FL=1